MGAPRRRGGERAKPPEIRGFSPCLRRTRGRTARAGFPRAQARTGGKSMPVRQGFGRGAGAGSRGGRGRKISQRAGRDGAGGLPPRAGPDRWKKYAGTAGFWPPRGGRAGAGAQNQSARGGERAKSVSAQGGTARAGFPPRAGPDRWKKYAGTAGFWPRGGGGQPRGAGAQNQSARGAGRRGRASPARRSGPMEKVCRYGRVLAAAGRGVGERAGGAKSVGARGAGGGHGAAAASLRRRGNRRGTGA